MMNMMITLAYMELIGQDDMYDEKKNIILVHMSCIITFEFN